MIMKQLDVFPHSQHRASLLKIILNLKITARIFKKDNWKQ